jgi:hypothetical protein
MAIFIQDLADMIYFAKASKKGCFPTEVTVSKGGFYTKTGTTKTGYTEKHAPLSGIGKIKEYEDFFKIPIRTGDAREVFLFKEDFETGEPEDLIDYFRAK